MSDNNEFGAFMSGLLLGGIAGAITALLLAPQSGEETRKVIIDKGLEIKDRALETVEDVRHRAEEAAGEARAAAQEYTQKLQEQAIHIQEQGRVILEEQKQKIEKVTKGGKKAAGEAEA
ncbi:MAG: YtxH domain-containing protein [Anaerolineales bacterium]|nr:YtxH domain-containing protein [Anaerolineales bacterium]